LCLYCLEKHSSAAAAAAADSPYVLTGQILALGTPEVMM
jgi:hypothetical protein